MLSATGFAAMPIFARQAYATGLELTPLLALRFVMAAALLWALVLLRRRPLGSLRGLALGAALGFGGYALQAGLYFGAIQRIDVGLASLLLYAYPSFVTLAAFALRRESPTRRKLGALALASSGVTSCSPAAARARSTGSASPWHSPAPASTPSSSSAPSARRRRSPPSRSRRASPPAPR